MVKIRSMGNISNGTTSKNTGERINDLRAKLADNLMDENPGEINIEQLLAEDIADKLDSSNEANMDLGNEFIS